MNEYPFDPAKLVKPVIAVVVLVIIAVLGSMVPVPQILTTISGTIEHCDTNGGRRWR